MTSNQKNTTSFDKAKDYALTFLSYRPRTEKEMKRKLTEKGFNRDTITEVVGFLKEYKFLNDSAFTRMWIRNRMYCKPSGKRRIYNELLEKGVSREIIEENLNDITPVMEYETMNELFNKKVSRSGFNYKKLEGFLIRRGFNPSDVRKILQEYESSRENDI